MGLPRQLCLIMHRYHSSPHRFNTSDAQELIIAMLLGARITARMQGHA
jgi:hypothetical protein